MKERVKMCRFCANLHGLDLKCRERKTRMTKQQACEVNQCTDYVHNPRDAITGKRNYGFVVRWLERRAREMEIYEKRMKGDWS